MGAQGTVIQYHSSSILAISKSHRTKSSTGLYRLVWVEPFYTSL